LRNDYWAKLGRLLQKTTAQGSHLCRHVGLPHQRPNASTRIGSDFPQCGEQASSSELSWQSTGRGLPPGSA
jgi:hypothetical protein